MDARLILWERLSSLGAHGQPAPLRKARPGKSVPTYHISLITYHCKKQKKISESSLLTIQENEII